MLSIEFYKKENDKVICDRSVDVPTDLYEIMISEGIAMISDTNAICISDDIDCVYLDLVTLDDNTKSIYSMLMENIMVKYPEYKNIMEEFKNIITKDDIEYMSLY